MAANAKILKALKSAATYLENSIRASAEKDENSLMDNVWHVAAELEYVLFLFSIAFKEEADKLKSRSKPRFRKVEVDSALVMVQKLLKAVFKHMKEKSLLEAYKEANIARHYMLKVQRDFAKKKREALKAEQAKKKANPPRKSSSP
jgi:hypothetical protein